MTIIQRKPRTFLPDDFTLTTWESIAPFFEQLEKAQPTDADSLDAWFLQRSELESFLMEEMAWRYVRMTCDTGNQNHQAAFQQFVAEIQPSLASWEDRLNQKALASPYLDGLSRPGYDILLRSLKQAVALFREENIPLQTEIQQLQTQYQSITGAMLVEVHGESITLPQAQTYLESTDRALREEVWRKIATRRTEDREALNLLMAKLVDLRHQVAQNAGYSNFRDYMFAALGRFDYTPDDCFEFHRAIQSAVMPLVQSSAKRRKDLMGLPSLRPWDKKVDPLGRPALKAFQGGADLIEKTSICLQRLDPTFGTYIQVMREMGHFDVESRPGKAPGGYNYPMAEVGVPFIFMNATHSVRDLVTMVHEAGHAIHSFLTKDLEIGAFKNPPSEVAELASMSMELISMDHWDVFFPEEEACRRAKADHLQDILTVLPWIAQVDAFQHRIYENPMATQQERDTMWLELSKDFSDTLTDYSGLESFRASEWHRQLHIFEVPFYYIEYGMAQLGAIALWRRYKLDPQGALEGYKAALSLGYRAPIGQIYAAAGIRFDFSAGYIHELMEFVTEELNALTGSL